MDDFGTYDQQLTLQSPPDPEGTQNSLGEPTGDWRTVATIWGQVEYGDGGKTLQVNQLTTGQRFIVRAWARADVTTRHRLQWAGKLLYVERIDRPDGNRGLEMVLTCKWER